MIRRACGAEVFLFDIDNTLAVWPEGKIPESAQYSLDELKRRGHRVAFSNWSYSSGC